MCQLFAKSNGNSRGTLSPNTQPPKPTSREGFKSQPEASKPRNHEIKCFKCQGFGHIASQCQNRQTMFLLENSEVVMDDEDGYEEMPPLEEEEVDSSEELLTNKQFGLVVRRVLATQIKEEYG